MKAIHYDAEGDILSITYSENKKQKQIGVELSDNIVLYYNPEAKTPIKLLNLSYGALMQANTQSTLQTKRLRPSDCSHQAHEQPIFAIGSMFYRKIMRDGERLL